MSNTKPITLAQLFRYFKHLPHQMAAISELEADILTAGYTMAMRRDRPWFKTWSVDGKQPEPGGVNVMDRLMPLLDLIAAGEGNYNSVNRGKAGDTPGGYPGLDRMTVSQVMALQRAGYFAVGRYQFIPETLKIAVKDSGMVLTDLFSHEGQDRLAASLLLGWKRPVLRDYLQGKNVTLEAAMLELGKEWASIPAYPDGRGFYDGDRAGNRASAKVAEVQRALKQARDGLAGKGLPPLTVPAQQPARIGKIPAHLRLTKTGKVDARGLHLLRLQEVVDGIPMGELLVVSGAPGRQMFRTGRESRAGGLEPLPEGRYGIEDIEWKGGRDVYAGSWGPGLGPVWAGLNYQAPGKTERSAIGIHLDENQGTNPGTAGCVGIRSIADLKLFVAMMRAHDPRLLFVDWGLGSCPPVRPV
jgi:hypothetical protein